MFIWTYAKVVFTSPGYARDFVPKTEEPVPAVNPHWQRSPDSPNFAGAENVPPPQRTPSMTHKSDTRDLVSRLSMSIPAATHQSGRHKSRTMSQGSAGTREPLPPPPSNPRELEDGLGATSRSQNAADSHPPWFSRVPSASPVLLPEYRYCFRDELVKPFRAHHCRACGTCVLKYDHHCPWVGQCVGARNHKFFVNFVFWATIFCIWILATLLVFVVKDGLKSDSNLDPQKIVTIVLAGVFTLFTLAIFMSHVNWISLNQTTVENYVFMSIRDRETTILAEMFPWYRFIAKRRTQQQWDADWGRIGKEGNIWWLGSRRENWEAVMGRNVWWWFLPIGHSVSDGMTYPVNPRFDSEGRWRRRAEWPPELR